MNNKFILFVILAFLLVGVTQALTPTIIHIPAKDSPLNITDLSFWIVANVSKSINASDIDSVWYYFSTTGQANSSSTSLNNVTSKENTTSALYNTSMYTDFNSTHLNPGYHTIAFCANNSLGNTTCSTGHFVIKAINISQIKSLSETTIDFTYENGTPVNSNIFNSASYNYSLKLNSTSNIFVEVIGLNLNETYMKNLANSNITLSPSQEIQQEIDNAGYTAIDFAWLHPENFLPLDSLYKYGKIELPTTYESVLYCGGTIYDPSCNVISNCTYAPNLTTYQNTTVLPSNSACYIEISNKTLIYADHFSGVAGGNDTNAPNIALLTPENASWNNANFILKADITDATGINDSLVFYRFEELTPNGTWTSMSNTTETEFNTTIDISSFTDGEYTLRFNTTDIRGFNSVENFTIYIDTADPVIHSFDLTKQDSITTGESLASRDFNCNASDNSESFGGRVSITVDTEGTGSTGSKTATCTARDLVGNLDSATTSYTVESTSSSTANEDDDDDSSSSGNIGGGFGGDDSSSSSSATKKVSYDIYTRDVLILNTLKTNTKLKQTISTFLDKELTSDIETSLAETSAEAAKKSLVYKEIESTSSSSTLTTTLENKHNMSLKDLVIYDNIPKTFAGKASDIKVTTSGTYRVIKDDPEFAIKFDNLDPGDKAEVSYKVSEEVADVVIEDAYAPVIFVSELIEIQTSENETVVPNVSETLEVYVGCGDSICDSSESILTCPQDCDIIIPDIHKYKKEYMTGGVTGLAITLIALLAWTGKRRIRLKGVSEIKASKLKTFDKEIKSLQKKRKKRKK
jgi:hypothetical protein